MIFNFNFLLMLFLLSCLMFTFFYKHILLTLISLEFMMINIFINLYYLLIFIKLNMYFISIFIGISICEGILGLSLLVYLIRFSGNDYTNMLNLMKW
uniref:NADH-ubiquinone oxidoreductase chain 4L n=1 Tax=Histeromerus sp. QL-2013 TaxID=1421637 RepID=A0A0A6ZKR6_9HYME|nr:NADH dehydrogenase subunit 4L [Histeromerus sp. QL-2013]